jgi:FolB domain-containing protein
MFKIRVSELEVHYRVGVPDEERAEPQRLLITVDMKVQARQAAQTDDVSRTVNYFEVSQDLLRFGEGRSWKLLERLSAELAEMILEKYRPEIVWVEVRKFIIPEARYVSVSCERSRESTD